MHESDVRPLEHFESSEDAALFLIDQAHAAARYIKGGRYYKLDYPRFQPTLYEATVGLWSMACALETLDGNDVVCLIPEIIILHKYVHLLSSSFECDPSFVENNTRWALEASPDILNEPEGRLILYRQLQTTQDTMNTTLQRLAHI